MKILYHVENRIGIMTLSAPPYNVLDDPEFENADRLTAFFDRTDIKAVIMRGAGRNFCAGADLNTLREQISSDQFEERMNRGKELCRIIAEAPVPTAAVIRGSCLGAGLELALSCCFRFASSSALIGFPETERGVMPGFGGTLIAGEGVRRSTLVELILSGRMVQGEEAGNLGLVHELAPAGQIENRARDCLTTLVADRDPNVIRSVMESINNGNRMEKRAALRRETELFVALARRNMK